MSDSRILILDENTERAAEVSAILNFLDMTPCVATSFGEVDSGRPTTMPWLAIVVGDINDHAANFIELMSDKATHPWSFS